jgi:CRP/FNR family transcriptional regulator
MSSLITSQCNECSQHKSCLSNGLNEQELRAFHSIVKQPKKLKRGEYLYQHGNISDTIYIIRSGSLKSAIADEEGREKVLNFPIQGDIVGLEAISSMSYVNEVKALETTFICEISVAHYINLAAQIPKLYKRLLNQMSFRIAQEEELSLMLGTKNANQKIASFLLSLAKRNSDYGFSDCDLLLNMSRHDIGSYLSVAMETVSRIFARLQDQGLIKARGKHIHIIDKNGLKRTTL